MATLDRFWDALTTVIKMNDKVEALAAVSTTQQAKIEELTGRVIRLETALEIALAHRGQNQPLPPPRLRR